MIAYREFLSREILGNFSAAVLYRFRYGKPAFTLRPRKRPAGPEPIRAKASC